MSTPMSVATREIVTPSVQRITIPEHIRKGVLAPTTHEKTVASKRPATWKDIEELVRKSSKSIKTDYLQTGSARFIWILSSGTFSLLSKNRFQNLHPSQFTDKEVSMVFGWLSRIYT